MSNMTESQVGAIIKSLNRLEDDMDSLGGKVSEMKKQVALKTQAQIDSLLEKTREIATKEAKTIINASKERATVESAKITQEGEAKLSQIKSSISANFDEAVKHVVSTVLKA